MLRAAGVCVTHPDSAATAQAELREAFAQARRGLTVAVLIPLDVLEADSQPLGNVPDTNASEERLTANAASIQAAADLIEGCGSDARIAIVAGRGATAADSVAALAHLGELTGALMGTTIMAKSLFDSSARNLGVVGTFSSPSTREFLAGTDVVIAAGASLNPFTTQKGALFPGAVVIQIDVDRRRLWSLHHAECADPRRRPQRSGRACCRARAPRVPWSRPRPSRRRSKITRPDGEGDGPDERWKRCARPV